MNWKKILSYTLIVLGFLVLAYAFTPQVLGGKIVNQSDISGWQGMAREAQAWNAAHPDDPALWSDSMFGGMPTVSYSTPTQGDLTQPLYKLLLTGRRPASYLFIALLGGFLLMLAFGVHPFIAIGGAVAIAFCSYNFQIIQVGHNTKMQAIAFMPWVLAAAVFTYRSKTWPRALLGSALFALAVSFQVKANHPQISYYLAIIIIIYAIAVFISRLVARRRVGRFFAVSALLVAFGLVGAGTNATKLIPTWDYTPHSMRGGTSASAREGGRKGLDIDYATAWSYGWEELPNMMIPNYNGGSSAGALGSDSQTVKLLKRAGQPNLREVSRSLPLYWGPQPFTAGPMYMGAITIFLFLLGLFCCRGKERWWLLAASILAILLAVGSHFMAFTRVAMAVLPLYNKFRTVSMALVILQVTLPLLGFITLNRIVRGKIPWPAFRRASLWALGLTAGYCVLVALVPSIAGSFSGASDAGQPEVLVSALQADRRALLVRDAWMSAVFIIAACGLLWWAYQPVAKKPADASEEHRNAFAASGRRVIAGVAVCVLVLVNMFATGRRYLGDDDFISPRAFAGQFDKRPVDEVILADTDPSYRVLDLTVNVFNDSHPSYWHKNIGGYSPAKLQIYQEYIENHLQGEISQLYRSLQGVATVSEAEAAVPELPCLSALNCRYIILDGSAAPVRNRYARGPVWFEYGGDFIEMTSYSPNELRYRYSSPSEAKAVFSEVYYPEGWTLTVADTGEELPVTLSDEVLRSAVVPAGEHELVMRFAPGSYSRGKTVSLICSLLTLLLAAGAVAMMLLARTRRQPAADPKTAA